MEDTDDVLLTTANIEFDARPGFISRVYSMYKIESGLALCHSISYDSIMNLVSTVILAGKGSTISPSDVHLALSLILNMLICGEQDVNIKVSPAYYSGIESDIESNARTTIGNLKDEFSKPFFNVSSIDTQVSLLLTYLNSIPNNLRVGYASANSSIKQFFDPRCWILTDPKNNIVFSEAGKNRAAFYRPYDLWSPALFIDSDADGRQIHAFIVGCNKIGLPGLNPLGVLVNECRVIIPPRTTLPRQTIIHSSSNFFGLDMPAYPSHLKIYYIFQNRWYSLL